MQYFELNRALSIKHHPNTQTLHVGLTPPRAVEIRNHVPRILGLIEHLEKPKTLSEIEACLRLSGASPSEVTDLVADLTVLGLIRPASDPKSRFNRHELYFGFEDLPAQTYESELGKKSVLLIGSGGIGSSCAMILAAAGVGNLILADEDSVELSNLTRSVLFHESDLGRPKVTACANRLLQRNSRTKVTEVPFLLAEKTIREFEPHFRKADFVILSGDSGPEVHHLTHQLSRVFGKPYLNAGYIETFGVVGPLIRPGQEGFRLAEEASPTSGIAKLPELNKRLQAPSYGPLNLLVSSIASNEAIRFLLNLPTATADVRVLVNSMTYEITFQTQETL